MELTLQTGTIESTLDDKGRVVIPAPFRDLYSGKLVITQGTELCVWVMTPAAYKHFIDTNKKESLENNWTADEIEAFEYQYESAAANVEMDPKTGRIPVPSILRTYANLIKDCYVVRLKGHLEIWNKDFNRTFMEEVRQINKSTHKKTRGRVSVFLDEVNV